MPGHKVPTQPLAPGRLACHMQNWQIITQDRWVLQGYQIDFSSKPHQVSIPPHAHTVNRVTSASKRGSCRYDSERSNRGNKTITGVLFLPPRKMEANDLRALNQFIQKQHFKMEGIHNLKDLLEPEEWLAKVDQKDDFTITGNTPDSCFNKGTISSQLHRVQPSELSGNR